MAMKYVKLFENWLLEADTDIEEFSQLSPKKFPVLETSAQNYLDCSDESKIRLLKSVFQRSKQSPDSTTFDLKAGLDLELEYFKFRYDTGWHNANYENRIKGFAEEDAPLKAEFGFTSQKECEKFMTENGKPDSANKIYYLYLLRIKDKSGMTIYFGGPQKPENASVNILQMVIGDIFYKTEGKYPKKIESDKECTLGMLVLLVNAGISEDNFNYVDKSTRSKYIGLCKGIFGGEGLTNIGKFAQTVKIGGMELDLASSGKSGDIIPLYVAKNIVGTCGFDFGKATLKEDGKATLSKKELWNLLADTKTKKIEIVGHTDSVGTEEVNLNLSKQRAETVLKFLQESPNFTNIKDRKITITGKGFEDMVEDDKKGKNKDAAAKNRRIVIKINDVGPDYSTLIK
jgi:flagellar motor protein MotB